MSHDPKPPGRACVEREARERIGRELRAMYSTLVQEPLPASLMATLASVQDAAERADQPRERMRRAA